MKRFSVLAALALLPAVVLPRAANAAPTDCTATEPQIFAPATALSGDPGDLLACRKVTLTEVPGDIR